MIVAIVGSRDYKHLERVYETMYHYFGQTFISGGARGVDSKAREVAKQYNQAFVEITPNYELFGELAPHQRNDDIVAKADKVIAFWNGQYKSGTYSVISKCLQRHKNLEVIFDD